MWILKLFVILVLISLLGNVVEALFITFPMLLPIIVIIFVFRYFKHNRDKFDAVVDWVNKIAFKKSDRTMCSICGETMYASDGLMLVDGIICKKTAAEMSPLLLQNRFRMRVSDVREHLEHRRKYGADFSTDLTLYIVDEDIDARGLPFASGRVDYSTKDRMFRFKIEHPETKVEQFEFVDMMDVENFRIEVVKERHHSLAPSTYDIHEAERKLKNERYELSDDEEEFYRYVLSYDRVKGVEGYKDKLFNGIRISKDSFYFYLVVSLKDPFKSDVHVRLNKEHIYEGEHRDRYYKYDKASAKLLKELNDLKESELGKYNQ